MSNPKGNSKANRMTYNQKKFLEEFIRKNPTATWENFNALGKVKISDACFYSYRRRFIGQTSGTGRRSSTPLYMTVWQYPSDKVDEEAKKMLRDLIENLNKRANWQLIELKDPAMLELREKSK